MTLLAEKNTDRETLQLVKGVVKSLELEEILGESFLRIEINDENTNTPKYPETSVSFPFETNSFGLAHVRKDLLGNRVIYKITKIPSDDESHGREYSLEILDGLLKGETCIETRYHPIKQSF